MTEQDKELVEEELNMHMAYDWFLDDNPDVQERVSRGTERGQIQGQLQGLRRSALKIIQGRFPSIKDLAQRQIATFVEIDELDGLIDQLLVASDEAEVRRLLHLPLA